MAMRGIRNPLCFNVIYAYGVDLWICGHFEIFTYIKAYILLLIIRSIVNVKEVNNQSERPSTTETSTGLHTRRKKTKSKLFLPILFIMQRERLDLLD